MRKVTIFFLFFMILNGLLAQTQEVRSTIQAAKVYLKGAQIQRECKVNLKTGTNKIVIVDLPPRLDGNSVQVLAKDNFKILSVNYRIHQVSTKVDKDSIDLLQAQDIIIIEQQEDLQQLLSVYQGEERMVSTTYSLHGADGLEPDRLEKMANLYRTRLSELKQKQIDLRRKISKLTGNRNKLRVDINRLSQRKTTTTGRVAIEIEAKANSSQNLTFSYHILDAGWYPKYDLRADDVDQPMNLEMRGDVWQTSGEDWNEIAISLSTANPTMNLDAPVLYPWILREQIPISSTSDYTSQYKSMAYLPPTTTNSGVIKGMVYDAANNQPLIGANVYLKDNPTIGTITDIYGKYELNLPQGNASSIAVSYVGYNNYERAILGINELNIPMGQNSASLDEVTIGSVNSNQVSRIRGLTTYLNWNQADVVSKDIEKSKESAKKFISSISQVKQASNQVNMYSSQVYEVERKHTIATGGTPQRVEIKTIELNSDFTYYCAPKLSEHVYLIATISDWEKHNLLNGQVNLFFEGTYIGKSLLDVKSFGDTIEVSFGPDKDVIVERKLISEFSKKQFIGLNKKETRVMEINVKNKKQKNISVIVQDQIPISATDKIDISHKVEDEDIEPHSLTGIITWEFDLEGNANKKMQFQYVVKMPKKVFLQLD